MVDKYELKWDKTRLTEAILTMKSAEIKKSMIELSVKKMALKLDVQIGRGYISHVNEIYKKCYKEDHLVVKYFCNIGFFRRVYQNKCPHCGVMNSRDHAIDDCKHFDGHREDLMKGLKDIDKKIGEMKMSRAIEEIYYRPRDKTNKKDKDSLLEWMRKCILTLYRTK